MNAPPGSDDLGGAAIMFVRVCESYYGGGLQLRGGPIRGLRAGSDAMRESRSFEDPTPRG